MITSTDYADRERRSLDTLSAALADAMGIEAPNQAAPANPYLVDFVKEAFGSEKADRVFLYNPDAIAQWIYEKYPEYFTELIRLSQCAIPFESPMPSVTPVCFATMYSGTQPEIHGIRKYTKPVLTVDTLFDAMIRAGKKPAIVSVEESSSMSRIFRERDMDYYIVPQLGDGLSKCAELILEDRYDFICLYQGNYDTCMHKNGPEAPIALAEARSNVATFEALSSLIRDHWASHNALVGFCMDHGCHEIDGQSGSHGLDMDEDLHILHHFYAQKRK